MERDQRIVRVAWITTRSLIEKFLDIVRLNTEAKENWVGLHGTGVGWEFYTYHKLVIPLESGTLVVRIYAHLAAGRGWISQWAVSIEWVYRDYQTEIDPILADQMIHYKYFNCFIQRDIRRALLGERITMCCQPLGHKGCVLSLQFICLRQLQHVQAEAAKKSRETTRGLWTTKGAMGSVVSRHHGGNKRGGKTPFPRSNVGPSLAILCRQYRVRRGGLHEIHHPSQ
ncbi:viral infectivity factor [Simian immunodeficiency virus]|uniref:Virion infectivity factor n=1 Tax=Simian immunodeficiency virus TaxID=11723 RepID=O90274_SIV|nr:viral infectivity factor [Simian immunodeficiency virus]